MTRPVKVARPRPDSNLSAPTLSLPFGVGSWKDAEERRVSGRGPCWTCGRLFEWRYEWQGESYCACHWYRARMESEAAAGREAGRRDKLLRRAG